MALPETMVFYPLDMGRTAKCSMASQAARRAGHVVLFVRRGEGAQARSTEGVGPESQALAKKLGRQSDESRWSTMLLLHVI